MLEFRAWLLLAPATAWVVSMFYSAAWCLSSGLSFHHLWHVLGRKLAWFILLAAISAGRALIIALLAGVGAVRIVPWATEHGWQLALAWVYVGGASFLIGFIRPGSSVLQADLDEGAKRPAEGRGATERVGRRSRRQSIGHLLSRPSVGIIGRLRIRCVSEIVVEVGNLHQEASAVQSHDLDKQIERVFGRDPSRNALMSVMFQVEAFLDAVGDVVDAEVRTGLESYFSLLRMQYAVGAGSDRSNCRQDLTAVFERLLEDGLNGLAARILTTAVAVQGSG